MLSRSYNDYLYRTSLERVAHGETSRATSDQLLQRARAVVERSRGQVSKGISAERVWSPCVEPERSLAAPAKGNCDPTLMELVSGRRFASELVVLDGKHFVECIMNDCTLEYSGYPVVLESTHFAGCRFQFQGHAAMTMQLMECLGYGGEGASEHGNERAGALLAARPN